MRPGSSGKTLHRLEGGSTEFQAPWLGLCATCVYSSIGQQGTLFCKIVPLRQVHISQGRSSSCTLVPATPQSEVLAKFFEEIGEKCGEILAKFFADFRPSISRENGRKNIHEKSSTFSTVHQIKFFHCCNSGGLGAQCTRAKWGRFVLCSVLCLLAFWNTALKC